VYCWYDYYWDEYYCDYYWDDDMYYWGYYYYEWDYYYYGDRWDGATKNALTLLSAAALAYSAM